jgi:hypothetical protein
VSGLSVVMPEPALQSNLSRVIDLMHSLSASPPQEEPEEKTKPRRTYTEQQRVASKARKKAKRIRQGIAKAASISMMLALAFLPRMIESRLIESKVSCVSNSLGVNTRVPAT